MEAGAEAVFSVAAFGVPDPTYRWQRNGAVIPGAVSSLYRIPSVDLSDDGSRFRCVVSNSEGTATSREAILHVVEPGTDFRRGDANADGSIDLSDAVAVLRILFVTDVSARCEDAVDANDDGTLNVADAITLLGFLFAGDSAPSAPFPACGRDPTEDDLGCARFPSCR